MFNRSAAFNRMPFGRPFSVEIMLSATLDGTGTVMASLTMDMTMSGQLDGSGELITDLIRELFMTAQMDGIGSLDADMIRERLMAAALNGQGSLHATMTKYHVGIMEIVGEFAPGEIITIDVKKLKITKNGTNALHMLQGDFLELNLGTNEIQYTDGEAARSVRLRITYNEKFA